MYRASVEKQSRMFGSAYFYSSLVLTVDVPALALPGGYIKGYVCNL